MLKKLKAIALERNMLSLSGNVLFAVLGFISFLILTRTMSKADFGSFSIYLTAATFVDLFRFGLTRSAIVRYLAGAKVEDRVYYLGSNAVIGLALVGALSFLIYSILWVGYDAIKASGFVHFFIWYPVLAIANLSWNNAVSFMQSYQGFGRIILIRVMNAGIFLLFLIINKLYFGYGITAIIIANIFANFIPSLWCLYKRWDGTAYLHKANKETISKIINFGKYSVGTLVGSSLLRSADTVIIGLAPILGPVGVAKYTIPLKLTEMIEIPLRSFMATAFPKLSKASIQNKKAEWKHTFLSYAGAITLLYIPFTILLFVFAEDLVLLLGGSQYEESLEVMTVIARIFAIYGLLLPLDRITGVALDSLERQKKNFIKVLFMALANIAGDLVAVFVFESLAAVAVATIFNTAVGLIFGYYFVKKEMPVRFRSIIENGIIFYKNLYQRHLQPTKK